LSSGWKCGSSERVNPEWTEQSVCDLIFKHYLLNPKNLLNLLKEIKSDASMPWIAAVHILATHSANGPERVKPKII
jgi:hypothetical protein